MGKYKNFSRLNNNGLLIQLLGYILTRFIIPFIILLTKLFLFIIILLVIPIILNLLKKKLGDRQRLLCNKCNGQLKVIDSNSFYCKNCNMIKMDNH